MKLIATTILTSLVAFCFVCAGAYYVNPPQGTSPLKFEQVRTDSTTVYPYVASPDRVYFVEKAN